MARYGTWRPLADNWAAQPRMRQWDIICLHTMVGSLWGTDAYFRQAGYGGTESHFGVGYDGETLQWQDTAHQADANYRGGWHVISVETADYGPGFPVWNLNDGRAVPPWTDAQIEALARLVAFLCREHNIPCQLIPDSKPGRRGIGYHRQGVPGYVVPGGELWSTKAGKVCPGDRRIAQIPRVLERAREILHPNTEGFLMALSDAEQREILDWIRVQKRSTDFRGHHGNPSDDHVGHVRSLRKDVAALRSRVDELHAKVDEGHTHDIVGAPFGPSADA